MAEEKEAIYDIMESLNIKIEHIYEEESDLDFSEINLYSYKEKCSILVLESDCISFNRGLEKRNEILEIGMEEFPIITSELNIPRYKYKIVSGEKTYLLFESNNRESLKEIMEKNRKGMEEEVNLKN